MKDNFTESPYNEFEAPIPGQSLTDTPGNAPWEHPPQFTDQCSMQVYLLKLL